MITLTEKIWDTICRVNRHLNWKLEYVSDKAQYGECEHWSYPESGKGDCEDFAIAKKAELKKHNIPAFLASCWTELDEYHVVVLIDTDRGTFVLDNRHKRVWHYQELRYKWHKRESADGRWYYIAYQQ